MPHALLQTQTPQVKTEIEKLFEAFYKKFLLTKKQREDAETKYNGVCSTLHNHYYPNTTYNGSTKLLIGSVGKSTHIRPPKDVDVLFYMPPEKVAQYDQSTSNGQSQLLQDIRKILKDKYTTTEIAVNAALTGHLLFSTLHNNDAATAVPRLIEKSLESDARVTAVSVHNKSLLHRVVAHTVKKRIDRSVSKSFEEEANGE
jgi:hypothetical protein|tara:strand:- start:406 stop:1008 length:603 start_codon:yes stop_codon:yes gene_type:complete